MDLTIIIPTKDRPEYLKNLIRYYFEFKFTGKIFVLDSSKKKNFDDFSKFLNNLKFKNVKHFRLLGRPFECTAEIKSKIFTKFVCWSGDDDFFLVKNLIKAINFLKKNKNISAINGSTITLRFKDELKIQYGMSFYKNFNSIKNDPLERLIEILKVYHVPIFSIFRTKNFKKMLEYVPSKKNRKLCPTRIIHDEYLESFLLVYLNKIKFFDFPFLIRLIPQSKIAKPLDKSKSLSKNNLRSFLYIKSVFFRLIKKEKDRNLFQSYFNKFINNINRKKTLIKVVFSILFSYFILFKYRIFNKKFNDFERVIEWMKKN